MKLLKKAMVFSMLCLFLVSNFTYGLEFIDIIIFVDEPIKGHH